MRDVIVIGAGPAGSIAATLLARAGRDVTLIEQHNFPRDKVCGECLSTLGLKILADEKLIDPVLAANPTQLKQTIFHTPAGQSVTLLLPEPMLGLSRRVLDQLLLDAAKRAGATVRQPARVENINNDDDDSIAITLRDLRDNRVESLRAKTILIADGKPSAATEDFGIKAHFENIAGPRDAIELFGVSGHYGGLAAIENGKWNTAFSVPANRLRASRGQLDELFADIFRENPSLQERFARAKRCSDWLASPLPRIPVSKTWRRNVIPIGNAAASLEPIGGEGMGLAMASAQAAARALIENREDAAGENLRKRFSDLWSLRSRACRAVAKILSSPSHSDAALSLVQLNPLIARQFMGWIGK